MTAKDIFIGSSLVFCVLAIPILLLVQRVTRDVRQRNKENEAALLREYPELVEAPAREDRQ